MDMDFPAAHSMDTIWFAVDRDGHVGMFTTGENGHCPEGADQTGPLEALEEFCWQTVPAVHVHGAPRNVPLDVLAESVGLFSYDYDNATANPHPPDWFDGAPEWWWDSIFLPYYRHTTPSQPIHVDQLPPGIRQQCQQFRFETVCFTDHKVLQPGEHFTWSEDFFVDQWLYLAADYKTVRPLPGLEEGFENLPETLHEDAPEWSQRLILELRPKKPRASRAGRKPRKDQKKGK